MSVQKLLLIVWLLLLSGCHALQPQAEDAETSSRLAFVASYKDQDYLFTSLPDGRNLRLLTFKGHDPSGYEGKLPGQLQWSPDGRRLLFSTYWQGDGELAVINADGTGLKLLTQNPGRDYEGRWSPDGSRILFTGHPMEDPVHQVKVMPADGSAAPRILARSAWSPTWSPDGTQVAFVSDLEGRDSLYIVSAEGGAHRRLGPEGGLAAAEPVWSPEGSRLAYTHCESGERKACQIRVIQADGTGDRALTPLEDQPYSPLWSPDGSELVFVYLKDRHSRIELIRSDGSDRRILADKAPFSFGPEWSPDGRQIVYMATYPEQNIAEIHLIGRDGSGPVQLDLKAPDGNGRIMTWPTLSR